MIAGAQTDAVSELEESMVGSDWRIAGAQTTRMWESIIITHLEGIAGVLRAIAAMALFIGTMGVASSISVNVVERSREIGVLKAIGGKSSAILALFASEAAMIALLGWAIALCISPWLSRAVSDTFGTLMIEYPFDYRPAGQVGLIAWAVATTIALLACIVPVRGVLGMTIHKALRSE
jgi:putative ABC transport system permease protein